MLSGLGPMAPPRGWVVGSPGCGQGHGIPCGMACFLPEWSWKQPWPFQSLPMRLPGSLSLDLELLMQQSILFGSFIIIEIYKDLLICSM